MTTMRMGWGAGARSAFVLLGAALLGAAGWAGQAAAATAAAPAEVSVSASPSASHPCGTESKPDTIKHVIFIVLENHSYGAILGSSQAPYFNTLAKDCGVATNYHNITHPSLPNYIAATSGLPLSSLKKFVSDCSPSSSCDTSTKSIFGQGETWKS
jgi:phosphatidylinositol-3-phosphatase